MKKRPPKTTTSSGPAWLKKKGWQHVELGVAYDPKAKKYYGYSHRGGSGFGIGDKLFDEKYAPKGVDLDKLPFVKRGSITIKTPAQAKLAARRMSKYLS